MIDGLRIALLLCGGGMAGGLLYWTSLYLASLNAPEDEGATKLFPGTRPFFFAHVFTGLGGAWAVLLALIWAKRAPLDPTLVDSLELFATSLVAGYAGNRLLPAVADELTKNLLKDAQRRTAKNARIAQRSELTSEVYTYLDGSGSDKQTQQYERKLTSELHRHPGNRKAAILLARLFDEAEDAPDKAIDVLQRFVRHKTANGAAPDADVADAYWNMANYMEKVFKKGGPENRRPRQEAIDALVKSIEITPHRLKDLQEDDDFAELRKDEEAKKRLPALAA